MKPYFFAISYIVIISIIAIIMTISDKSRAKKSRWRIKESSLLLVGLMGGACAEFITMKIIRHKTKHAKFMIILPLEIFLHIIITGLIIYKVAFV